MIWESIPLMTLFDLVIFSLAAASLRIFFIHRGRLVESNFLLPTSIVVTGLFLIGIFYLSDLLIMWILPLFTTPGVSMAVMEDLHLNYSWINILVVTGCFVAGFSLMIQKLLQQSTEVKLLNEDLRTELKERKQAEEALKQRFEFEELLSKISSEFINLPANEIDKEINSCLGLLGEFMKVDRVYISEFSEDQSLLSIEYEWAAKNIQPRQKSFQNLEIDSFPWLKERRLRGDTIIIPSIDDLPEEANPEREILAKFNVKSLASVPLFVGGTVLGSVGFDSTVSERNWSDELIKQLKLVGEIFANAMTRKRFDEALEESEERLKLATAATQLGTYDWYPLENIVYWDEQMHELFGLSERSRKDRNEYFFSILHPKDSERVSYTMQSLMDPKSNETNFKYEYRIILKNEVKHIATQGLGFRNEKGVVTRIIGTCLDISEHKKAQEALQESEERFRKLSESTFEGIAVSDKGRILDANEQLAVMLRTKLDELIGMNAIDFVAPESRELVAQHIKSGSEEPYEHFARRKDGSNFPVEVRAKSLPFEGQMVRVTAISDITERKQAETALRETEETARALLNGTTDMALLIKKDGYIIDLNDVMAERLGSTKEKLIGRIIYDFLPPELAQKRKEKGKEAARMKKPVVFVDQRDGI